MSQVEETIDKEEGQTKKRRKRRLILTEDGEIDLTKATIKELIKDGSNFGKPTKAHLEREDKSKRQNNGEIIEESVVTPKSPPKSTSVIPKPTPKKTLAPQVQIVDGRIVLVEQSLTVETESTEQSEPLERVEESSQQYITSSSFRNRPLTEKWKTSETKSLYKALCQYGTDFSMLENLFPHRTRRQIKNKFKKEERENPHLIEEALKRRVPIDFEEYKKKAKLDELPPQIEETTIETPLEDTTENIPNKEKEITEPIQEEEIIFEQISQDPSEEIIGTIDE